MTPKNGQRQQSDVAVSVAVVVVVIVNFFGCIRKFDSTHNFGKVSVGSELRTGRDTHVPPGKQESRRKGVSKLEKNKRKKENKNKNNEKSGGTG